MPNDTTPLDTLKSEIKAEIAQALGFELNQLPPQINSTQTATVLNVKPNMLGVIARSRGMAQLAKETGLSSDSLYKAFSPEGNPEFSTILKVSKALGIKLHAELA
jgi:probable addiction module antidote protein